MSRYKQLNEHYVLDTYTNKKLSLNETVNLLNTYEDHLQQQRRQYICQTY